jgi:hypothetical protein
MTSKRKLFGALAFSAALAGGGVAGALLGTPGTSGAQDTTTTTVAGPSSSDAPRPHRPGLRRAARAVHQVRRTGIDAAAKALDMTPEALRSEVRSGKSVADVAKEKDVPVQDVIDAVVAAEKARMEEEITKLPDQVTNWVNHTPPKAPADGPEDQGPPS